MRYKKATVLTRLTQRPSFVDDVVSEHCADRGDNTENNDAAPLRSIVKFRDCLAGEDGTRG